MSLFKDFSQIGSRKGRFYNRFVPMQWHFRSILVVLSIKTVVVFLFPAVPFHVNKMLILLFTLQWG
jgi:hypothetical protein